MLISQQYDLKQKQHINFVWCIYKNEIHIYYAKIKIQFSSRIKYNNAKNAIVWLVKIQDIEMSKIKG